MTDTSRAWTVLRQAARSASDGRPVAAATWEERLATMDASPEARALLDLYAPLCVGESAQTFVAAHLGQSLDGRIATEEGSSKFITGEDDLAHTHRMRALFDAVIVGARTVLADDPQLTTRRVPGDNPTRVILDPHRRLGATYRVFQDGLAPTLLVCAAGAAPPGDRHGNATVVAIDTPAARFPCRAIIAALADRGLRRLFVEGGGVTVSHFIEAGALDRLHLAIAPVILGSGRPALSLPPIAHLTEALTVTCRHFPAGKDMLFDCTFPRT